MFCEFEKTDTDDKPWKCKNCAYKCKVNAKRACSVPQNTHPQNAGPSFLQKAINFSSAVVHDVATGMQRCTEEEMDERIEICKTCPFYNQEDSSCNKCGCPLSRQKIYRNKLYWKSSGCPIGKWPDLTENTKDKIN